MLGMQLVHVKVPLASWDVNFKPLKLLIMKNPISNLHYLFVLVLLISCDTKSEIQVTSPGVAVYEQAQQGTTFFGLLDELQLDIRNREAYSTEALFNKYSRVQHEFASYTYAKAAKAQIIIFLSDSTSSLKDNQVTFLLEELKRFDMAYPKQHFLLLEEAQQRHLLSPSALESAGQYAYQKALSKSYVWESENISPSDSLMDGDSYGAQAYNQNLDRAIYTQKLAKYALD